MLKNWLVVFICWVIRGLAALRYRVSISGLEHLHKTKSVGTLFFSNHPSEIDPVILTAILWKKFRVRPVVVDNFYYLKGAHYLQTLVNALPFPNFDGAVSKEKRERVGHILDFMVEGLTRGESFLIYPAGQLKRSAEETIGGASFVYHLTKKSFEHANVVLVRITGLWGSRFSTALTGASPSFGKVLLDCIKIIFKNLIFFTPRRDVRIELEGASEELSSQESKINFNRYLEDWFNRDGMEDNKNVIERFWKSEKFTKFVHNIFPRR
jgi:1-acyl-sn-glycerol-3-phosphate acyltransferase